MTQQNVTQVAAEHAQTPSLRARLRVMATLHNISPGFLRRHVTYRATPERRTGVRVADDAGERLRQEMVQAPVGRGQPFYFRHAPPARLERRLIRHLALDVQRPIGEVESCPHGRIVA